MPRLLGSKHIIIQMVACERHFHQGRWCACGWTNRSINKLGDEAVNTYTLGTDTYAIFDRQDKGNLLMLHFLWGKKDFRVFLERKGAAEMKLPEIEMTSAQSGEFVVTRLQYLFEYEWYDYAGLGGHGLAHDEVRWKHDGKTRYLELPLHFLDRAVELVAMEFSLSRKKSLSKTG